MANLEIVPTPPAAVIDGDGPAVLDFEHITSAHELLSQARALGDADEATVMLSKAVESLTLAFHELASGLHRGSISLVNYPTAG